MAQFGANRVYQDFEPFFEWSEDKGSVTLTIMLPGFRRDQLRVQVTSTPVLRINGEREVTQNVFRRFSKEFSIPSYCDTNNVSAKFERGVLNVKFPKIEIPNNNNKPQEQQKQEAAPIPQQEASSQKSDDNNDVGDQEKSQKEEKLEEEEKNISDEKKDQEKEGKKSSEVETEKGKEGISSERKGSRIAQRLKTRMLDFTLSVSDEKDVDGKGYVGNLVKGAKKRPKMLVNIVVAILLVMVFGIYVKHALWSSSSSPSSSFEEGLEKFMEF